MAITSITTDYSGRTKDLFISQGVDPTKAGKQPIEYTFGKISSCVTGVEKLIQRFLISLFNTGVASKLQMASGSNIQEATHILNFACWDVLKEFKDYQSTHTDMPPDEQLTSAQVMDLEIVGDKLNTTIQIMTGSGESVPFILPVAIV